MAEQPERRRLDDNNWTPIRAPSVEDDEFAHLQGHLPPSMQTPQWARRAVSICRGVMLVSLVAWIPFLIIASVLGNRVAWVRQHADMIFPAVGIGPLLLAGAALAVRKALLTAHNPWIKISLRTIVIFSLLVTGVSAYIVQNFQVVPQSRPMRYLNGVLILVFFIGLLWSLVQDRDFAWRSIRERRDREIARQHEDDERSGAAPADSPPEDAPETPS